MTASAALPLRAPLSPVGKAEGARMEGPARVLLI